MFSSPAETNLCYGHEVAPACPRCDSLDTKFCYYNNYSLSQPRYYCKNCRRYWTKGGSLRNIPAGKGCGKRSRRRRQSSSSSRFCQKENQSDHHDGDSSCPEIDLAAVFANYLNGQSLNSSTFNIAKSYQVTKKIEDEGLGQFLEDDMFQFQGLLNDKEIQEILNCSFSAESKQEFDFI